MSSVTPSAGRSRSPYHPPAAVTTFSELARDLPPPSGVPTLLVRATLASIPPEQVERWRSSAGRSMRVAEVHCGHLVYLELPGETAKLIRWFSQL